MVIEELIILLKQFEERNNISVILLLGSDGSCGLEEFWESDSLCHFDTLPELINYLKNTYYELDEKGVCYSPVRYKPTN